MIDKSTKLSDYGNNNYEDDYNSQGFNRKDNTIQNHLILAESKINGLYKNTFEEQINFINFSQTYCIGFIDIVNSSKATSRIQDSKKLRKYYSIFLNSISPIVHQYNGKVIKNSGDNLFFYFPKTSDVNSEYALKDAFDCVDLIKMSRIQLNTELLQENLPEIDFRISMDYGTVEVALSSNKNEVDLFGSVVNICAKMNHLCKTNGIVIGKRLYEMLENSSFIADYEIQRNETNTLLSNGISYNIFFIDKKFQTIRASSDFNLNKRQLSSNISSTTSSADKKHIYNVLIVDDDRDILYAFSHLLKTNGYGVKVYSNPVQALKHFMETAPHGYDLVILDIRMPDINGIKLFYWLKAIDPYMNILFVSALDVVDEFITALPGINIKDIVKKPLDNTKFLSKIAKKLSNANNKDIL